MKASHHLSYATKSKNSYWKVQEAQSKIDIFINHHESQNNIQLDWK